MEQTLYKNTSEAIMFDKDDLLHLQDILLDCYNGEIVGNPLVPYLKYRTGYKRQEVEDAFTFYIALETWSHMPFPNALEFSNLDRNHWIKLYYLYESNRYKKRSTKLKKMFEYIAGIKLD